MDLRAAFEKWCIEFGWVQSQLAKDHSGIYGVSQIQGAWEGYQAAIKKALPEIQRWKSAHNNMRTRCALLRQRPDLPVDRIPAYDHLIYLETAVDAQQAIIQAYEKQLNINQCDGCMSGAPLVDGKHKDKRGLTYMSCQKAKYIP